MIFVCGRFDILHPGHVKLLEVAKNLADGMDENLCVYVNSDKSCQDMGKPAIMEQDDRMSLLTSLSILEDVEVSSFFFDNVDARELVKELKESVSVTWILGDDHKNEDFTGLEDVQIIFVKRSSHSSSALKEKMRK